MKIGGKYYNVEWDDFKKIVKDKAPKGYKFKKNEVKNFYKTVIGAEKSKRKEDKAEKYKKEQEKAKKKRKKEATKKKSS